MTDSKAAPSKQPEEQVICDLSDLRKYRTELPNLYDDADMTVYEYRLLGHYKRVGICTESLETTAKKCQMSEGKASQARQSLADKGFVSLQKVQMDAMRYRYIVRVVDRWIENFARYSGLSLEEIAEQIKKASASPHEAGASPGEGKKELIKNLDDRFAAIAKQLSELTGGSLNTSSADLISTWMEIHPDEWIFKAIGLAKYNGARHQNYVDKILVGWEANGYPKTREEKVQGAKNGNSRSNHQKRTNQQRTPVEPTPADIELAAEINASV